VTALERGKYGAPGAASLAAVAETLGISVEWLLFGKGDAPTEESVRVAVEAASSKEAA
jgi:transcriptional regulator with XRE-family HTH domain